MRESEFPDKASLKVQVTESLYISPHMHISDPFRLTLGDPLLPTEPHPLGVYIHGDRLGDMSHLSSRGVNALLAVFITVTRSEDEAKPWRDISKGSEMFEQKKNTTVAATTPCARGNFVYGPVRHNIPQRLCAHECFQ